MSKMDEFLEDSVDLVLVVKQYRYGGGYYAFICREEIAGSLAASYDTLNGDSEVEMWGLGGIDCEWCPVAYGDTVQKALDRLTARIESTEKYWHQIRLALEWLTTNNGPRPDQVCQHRSFDQLMAQYHRWSNLGIHEVHHFLSRKTVKSNS